MTDTVASSYQLSPAWTLATLKEGEHNLRYAIYQKDPTTLCTHTVVLINGRCEFIEKYAYLADDLDLPPTCRFVTWDHRGQGASTGPRSYIDHYETYARDARRILAALPEPSTPYLIIAHSMGSLIALYASLRNILKPQRLILCSPFLGLPAQPFPVWFSKLLAATAVHFGLERRHVDKHPRPFPDFPSNPLTNCKERFLRLLEAPYPGSSVTFGWVTASLAAITRINVPRLLAELSVPVTVLMAEDETVVDPKATLAWLAKAREFSMVPIEHHVIAGGKHELLSECGTPYAATLALLQAPITVWLQTDPQTSI